MLYPSNIPYMKTLARRVLLDRGTPPKKGNLVFLFTETLEQSLFEMEHRSNFGARGFVPLYFYPSRYIGYLNRRRYRQNLTKELPVIAKKVNAIPGVTMYPAGKRLVMPNEKRSLYYDLSKYLELYRTCTSNASAFRKIDLFWSFFRGILEDSYGQLNNKCVLIDAANFSYKASGKLSERIDNPLYLFYMTLYRNAAAVAGLDIDFLIFAGEKVLKINFSKIEGLSETSKAAPKAASKYLAQLKLLYTGVAEIQPPSEPELTEAHNDQETEELEERPDLTKVEVPNQIKNPAGEVKTIRMDTRSAARIVLERTAAVTGLTPDTVAANMLVKDKSIGRDVLRAAASDMEDSAMGTSKNDDEEREPQGEVTEETEAAVEEELATNEETVATVYSILTQNTTPKSQRSSTRDAKLREEQGKIQVKGMTLEDLAKINPKEREIPKTDVKKVTNSTNPNIGEVKFNNFNKAYVDEVMTKDLVAVFENLNTRSIKMFIRDIEVTDTSTVTDLKETWVVHLEDENRSRHTIKFDIPKFFDKNFLWIGGNKKNIKNQLFFLPLVKISSNTVMVVSNYNKMTVTRLGGRSLVDTTLVGKLVEKNPSIAEYFKKGSATGENTQFITTLEYDEYAKQFLSFSHNSYRLYFNQKKAREIAEKNNIAIPDDRLFLGLHGSKPIFIGIDSQETEDGKTITDLILNTFSAEENKLYSAMQMKVPKRVMYTEVTTMKQGIPMMILLCIWEGLSTVLEKAKVQYTLTEKLRGADLKRNQSFIKFKDCYLVYTRDIPTELLMNGIRALPTENYELIEMNTDAPYIPYVEKKYGKISILNALNNVYEFTIGPIEREILLDLKLPTDLVSLMIHANYLLADSQHLSELNMTEYRVRSAEIIPAILYDCIAKAYVPYRNSNGKKKLSIPQDAVIKKLLALETVENTSSLNPFLELETTHGVSTKGWRGVNLEHSYTVPKRCYDDTMRGIIGVSNSPDGQVGVNRTLAMEPNVNSLRGYLNTEDDVDKLKDVNLFSPAELLIPLGATRDDPIRIGHSVKQSRASVPVKNMSPVLISNGSDESCKHYLSSDYVVMAEQDGKVIEYDEKAEIMMVEYKDGTHRAVNLGKNIVKNGGGGFELTNSLVTDLKVGDTFKANEALGWHKNFFKKIPHQGVRLCVGALVKVALYSTYNTYEDGTFITESLSDKCETEMTFPTKFVIGKNATVFNMKKVGDEVRVGEPLIEFDESFEEGDINALLAKLGDDEELREVVVANNRNMKKSDKSGIIDDIKIYSASELEDLSPSLQKIVGDYYAKIDRKTALLSKYDKSEGIVKCGVMITESSGTTQPNKYGVIRGEKVRDGVLIEFHIKHSEPLEIGSKIANFSPLKNVIGEVIPAGYEPRSEFRPDEIVETIINPSSILNRMVGSVYPTIFGNKVIIELKRKLWDIYSSNDYATGRRKMMILIEKFFNILDTTGANTKKYKEMLGPLSEPGWKKFFKEFFSNEDHYLILDMVDYERTVTVEQLEEAADLLGIPLYEYMSMPHITMDNENPMVTPHKVPVGYIHIKRPQQTVMKKNGMSTGSSQRAGITNQVTGDDKNGRESDLENSMLVSMGMEKTLKELNGPRADDSIAEKEMLQSISAKGYFNLDELTNDVENKATLNAVDTYFLGMGLKTDLITKGLKLPRYIDQE